ncbi:hypothetical protein J4212_04385 [Candidatus Woesearchaeota archaeon]|nr:hypothetical protein [Candidatus Woesearchaeota archaeon]
MIDKTTRWIAYLILLVLAASFASAANMTISQLINSYDYSYYNGTINVTSYNDYMIDKDSNGKNDTLIINLTTDAGSGTFTFIAEIDNGDSILVNSTLKALTASDKSADIRFPSELLSKERFNYSIRINNNNESLVFRKFNIEIKKYTNYETGTAILSTADENVNNNFLRINLTINSTAATTENITVTLAYNSSTISKTEQKTLSTGIQTMSIDFDNETVKSTHFYGNFTILSAVIGSKAFDINTNTSVYNYEDFAQTSYIKSISDGKTDSNNNNLSEFLEINFTIEVKEAATYTVSYDLYDEFDNFVTNISKSQSLNTGNQKIQTLANGTQIYKAKVNGPYLLTYAKLSIGNDTKDILFDAHTTNQSFYTDYERPPLPDLNVSIDVFFDESTNATNITVNISNDGTAPAFNVFLDIFDNTTYNNNRSDAFLDVGESIAYKFNITGSSNATLYTAIADFDNLVDESDETNNIAQNTESAAQVVSLAIDSITEILSNGTLKTFEFIIHNDGDTEVTDIYWNFDTDDNNIIQSTENITSLAAGERAFVYLKHNFSTQGTFNVKANATGLSQSGEVSAFLTSTVSIGDLIISSFDDLSLIGQDAIFEFNVLNNQEGNLSDINWTLSAGDGSIINATQTVTLSGNETIFGYVKHSYASTGTFNASLTAESGSISDSASTIVEIADQTENMLLDFELASQNSTKATFSFKINNTEQGNLTGINWTLDNGESIMAASSLINLEENETLLVFASHSYPNTGDYGATATAFTDSISDSDTISFDLEDIELRNLTIMNASGNYRLFEIVIENALPTNLTNVSWAFDTKDSNVINSTSILILQPEEAAFVYVSHNFSTTGSYNVNFLYNFHY